MNHALVPEAAGELGLKLVARMERLTWDHHARLALDNAERNLAHAGHGQSLAALRDQPIGRGSTAVVVAAGPSIKRRDPAKLIRASGYDGAIVATESALRYCLRNGIVPDLAVTVDPHPTRIVRWFGDRRLSAAQLAKDDWFARQDQDDAFAEEMRANDEILKLLDDAGPNIRMALSTSASPAVVERVLESRMRVYWWNPMLDDPDQPGSVTAELQRKNGFPCVNAGGNVGSACWMMASAVLGKTHVALTGVDFSYYADTPYRRTAYYREAVALVGEANLDSIFIRIFNPHVNAWFYTDPAYMWYRECLLEMVQDADCTTYNCTEGGILFGAGVECVPFAEFLAGSSAHRPPAADAGPRAGSDHG